MEEKGEKYWNNVFNVLFLGMELVILVHGTSLNGKTMLL